MASAPQGWYHPQEAAPGWFQHWNGVAWVGRSRPLNVTFRAPRRGGWLGLLSDDSRKSGLDRGINELNASGYRVAFVVSDEAGWSTKIARVFVAVITLGFVITHDDLLVIGELDRFG